MLYFVPAWYQAKRYCENEQVWYQRRMHTEFDDTVKQMQLFHRNKAYPYQLLLLGYSPNLRHFLHRQSVYHAPYWSCFDAIQQVRTKKAAVFSYENLLWPEGTEFIYTSFAIIAICNGVKYAVVEFGEDGNMIRVDMYEENQISRRNIYDDRGFVSSTIIYEDGKQIYQDFLDENGVWKIRHFLQEDVVLVNRDAPTYTIWFGGREITREFEAEGYQGMESLLMEVANAYIALTAPEDMFCVAMDLRHVELVQNVLSGRKKIFSFYQERLEKVGYDPMPVLLAQASFIVADSQENVDKLRAFLPAEQDNIIDITPYDSRVDFGISSQVPVQKILVPVDNMEEEILRRLILALADYCQQNARARVHLFTRVADYSRPRQMLQKVRDILEADGRDPALAADAMQGVSENTVDDEGITTIFIAEQCVDELSVSKCMREQRILVDMRVVPELYIQIMGLSVGIPQIVRNATQFVEVGRNGRELGRMEELSDALRFYLGSLTNWNAALVASYEIGKKFSTDVLVDKWKEVIERVGANEDSANRQ